MDQYVTGAMIKQLREQHNMTQAQLADKLLVSDKTVSKWETGHGYPDISLLEPLAEILGVSVIELFAGKSIINANRSFNMTMMNFYVCPICGNIISSTGKALISCCGLTLPSAEAESPDSAHEISVENIEDEIWLSVHHDMSKEHYISFMAVVRDNSCEITKLYPEGPAEARFKKNRTQWLYFYCNKHGLFRVRFLKSHSTRQSINL